MADLYPNHIPRLALSVRQPWAFCLAMGWK